MIQLLFRHGAVPDSPDALGRTALHYAALGSANADPDLIDTLIAAGASVNVADAHGCTPLDLAAGAQNQAAAMALLRAGATCRADRVKWVQRVSGEDPASGSSDRSRSP
jgi:ankyrin repeat protein